MKKIFAIMLALTMLFSLVACGSSKKEDTEDFENSFSLQQNDTKPEAEENSDDEYRFDIEEDDHTVVITIGNTIQVYTHDGVNVTGYTTYVDAGDAETAKAVASTINLEDSYYSGMGIKSVTSKGKYVIQEYDSTGFPCTTYEELHDLAEQFGHIIGSGIENESFPEGDPVEYSREYWEEKYPGENLCPFYIEEYGIEFSYYWISGLDGWDGTMASWINQPFNWNGWHITDDGCIVNSDETLKITDNWANGDDSMSSCCVVTTEEYDEDNVGNQDVEVSEDWPFADYAKPKNCVIDEIEDWGSLAKVYVIWDSKDAAKAYKEELGLSGGIEADIEGAYEFNSGSVMISYSETDTLANFVLIYK